MLVVFFILLVFADIGSAESALHARIQEFFDAVVFGEEWQALRVHPPGERVEPKDLSFVGKLFLAKYATLRFGAVIIVEQSLRSAVIKRQIHIVHDLTGQPEEHWCYVMQWIERDQKWYWIRISALSGFCN